MWPILISIVLVPLGYYLGYHLGQRAGHRQCRTEIGIAIDAAEVVYKVKTGIRVFDCRFDFGGGEAWVQVYVQKELADRNLADIKTARNIAREKAEISRILADRAFV